MSDVSSNAPHEREELRKSILNAVSGKEDVISSFSGGKKPKISVDRSLERRPFGGLGYLIWNFLGGLFFGLGLLVMVVIIVWVLSNFDAVRAVTDIFAKFIGLLQSLGR